MEYEIQKNAKCQDSEAYAKLRTFANAVQAGVGDIADKDSAYKPAALG